MDLELTVNMLLPVVKGQSARGEWTKQEVIFEIPGEYSRKLCVGFWNDRAVDAAALRPGDRVALSVNIESREYNGRWYTEVRAWRMSRLDVVQQPAQAMGQGAPTAAPAAAAPAASGYTAAAPMSAATAPETTSADEVDDLPF
ncbi:DUF3127 domain-containing protein [uncultured Rikenella sp.]|uniref:DUF3127 domain-containing protein n=1 Tax=uncultured Rikenella sp. TaxID=368003 RepID=UPI0025F5E88C|nr:DUF3127 domain-containing protein [uncultured Rikenella sp.]